MPGRKPEERPGGAAGKGARCWLLTALLAELGLKLSGWLCALGVGRQGAAGGLFKSFIRLQ